MQTEETVAHSFTPSEYERREKSGSVMRDAAASFVPPDHKMALLGAAALMLGCGSFDSLASKWQNKQYLNMCGDPTNPDCDPQYFEAPFLQTLMMYIGEVMCLLVYLCDGWVAKCKGRGRLLDFAGADSMNKKKSPVWWWLAPTVMDYIASTMLNYAIVITLASTVQLLRNFNIVITAILTIFYLRRPLTIGQWIGVCVVTVGMILTAMYAIINPTSDSNIDESLSWLGCVLAVVATVLSGFQFVFEERLFRKYFMPPLKAVGTEGMFGLVISVVALLIVQFTGLEDEKGAFYQIGHSGILVWSTVAYILCITGFNAGGLMVTKLGSGLLRAVLVAGRSVLVWILELCIGWNTFDILDFFGMLVIAIGVLYYNNAYPMRCCPDYEKFVRRPVPCCGFVDMPGEAVKEAEDVEEILEEAKRESDNVERLTSSSSSVLDKV